MHTEARRAPADSRAGLTVTWSQPYGAPLPALTSASRSATLVVVGTRAHGADRQRSLVVVHATEYGFLERVRIEQLVAIERIPPRERESAADTR